MKDPNTPQNGDLPKLTEGSILDPQALAVLRDAIEAVLGPYPGVCYPLPFDKLLPPLACSDDLLDLAWQVLGGNSSMVVHFRHQLNAFAGGAPFTFAWRRVSALFTANSQAIAAGSKPGSDKIPRLTEHPLVPAARLLPIAAAAIYAARDLPELLLLLGSLEIGLAGLPELARLYNLGVLGSGLVDRPGLQSAYNTAARRVISSPWPEGTGGSFPGRWPPGRPGIGWPPGWPGGGWPPGRPGSGWPPGWPGGGWPGNPIPVPGALPQMPVPPEIIDDFEACLEEMIPAMHRGGYGISALFGGSGNRYAVTAVSPDYACPGDTITLDGSGFSGAVEVRFSGPAGRTVSTTPDSVSDDRITVSVPEWALTGAVWPYIPERIYLCHGRSITMARPGDAGQFLAGRTRVARFEVDSGRSCVALGEAAVLNWAVEPTDADVIISQEIGGASIDLYRGEGPAGSISLDTTIPGPRSLSIDAGNLLSSCPREERTIALNVEQPPPTLTIVGVEVTQGIQRFDLSNPEDPANNSVSLVAGMDTVVRVFVESNRGGIGGDQADITGYMTLGGRSYRPINGNPRGSQPIITAKPSPSRNLIDDSLNFLVPAAQSRGGAETLHIEVFTTERCPGFVSTGEDRDIGWLERDPLPVTIRRIADPHTGDVVSEAEALRIVTRAFDRLPSPPTEIRMRPGVFSIPPFSAEANYCHEGGVWQLALSVAYEHNGVEGVWPDPHESVWIGMFFQSGCNAGGMMSWPWTSTCISQRDQATAAHEIAHCVGMGHTRTSAGGACDDLFQPVACHDLPNDGRLPDVVFDIRNNSLITMAWDLMSYQSGYRYPHPDHWEMIRTRMDGRF